MALSFKLGSLTVIICQPTLFCHLHFSETFRWTSDKNYTLVKEVRFLEPYLYKSGSKLTGQKWKAVADNLNCLQAFKDSPRDQRSVRERFHKMTCSTEKSERKKPSVGFFQNHSLKQSNLPRRSCK